MRTQSILLLSLAALALGACADVKIKTPVATVAPSELLRDGTGEVSFRSDPARLQTTTLDASERPPTFDNLNEGTGLLEGDFAYGIMENLQLSVGLTSDIGLTGQAAYQFVGKPWAEAENGWSAVAHLDLAYTSFSKTGNQNGNFGAGGYPWKANISMSSWGGGVSAGYRWSRTWMGFAGTSMNAFKVKTTINQDPTSDGSSAGGNYSETNDGTSWATGVGLMIGSGNIRLIPTCQWVEYKIDQEHERGLWWGLSLNFGGGKPTVSDEK